MVLQKAFQVALKLQLCAPHMSQCTGIQRLHRSMHAQSKYTGLLLAGYRQPVSQNTLHSLRLAWDETSPSNICTTHMPDS